MKHAIFTILFALALLSAAGGDILTWDYKTGWNKGFVLTANTENKTISFYDRTKEKRWSQTMNNPKNSVAFIEVLLKRIKKESIGEAADDGPLNTITLVQGKKQLIRRVYNVNPPGSIFYNKEYPVEDELIKADRFLKDVDGFLLLSQLQALKGAYFKDPDKLWWAEHKK
jgi:hypothetical protein